jgi:hypothetical protein
LLQYVEAGLISSIDEYFDFGSTCLRSDGTLYGTGGKCRIGTETSPASSKNQGPKTGGKTPRGEAADPMKKDDKPKFYKQVNEKSVSLMNARELENAINNYKLSPKAEKLIKGELQKNKKLVDNLRGKKTEELKKVLDKLSKIQQAVSVEYNFYRREYERYKKGGNPEALKIAKENFEKIQEIDKRYFNPLKEAQAEYRHRMKNSKG